MQGWRRLNRGADVIAGLSRRHPCRLSDVSTYLSRTAQRVLRIISMQKSKPKYACLPSKIFEVWIDQFASVMIDDVGCSRRHQCPRCDKQGWNISKRCQTVRLMYYRLEPKYCLRWVKFCCGFNGLVILYVYHAQQLIVNPMFYNSLHQIDDHLNRMVLKNTSSCNFSIIAHHAIEMYIRIMVLYILTRKGLNSPFVPHGLWGRGWFKSD